MRHGILLVDKPCGPTSHDVVERVRHALGIKKVGHMGTLDPLATGLLLLGVGEGTKLTPFLSGLDKTYRCTARLGARSSTYDAMGEIESVGNPGDLGRERIEEALRAFRGTIEQLPPPFSAIKVKGRPLYKYARAGEEVERQARRVRIDALEIGDWSPPDLRLLMRVGSGTYVRSVVHDLGEALEVGAYVTELRRTAVGEFKVEEAIAVTVGGTFVAEIEKGMRTLAEGLSHMPQARVPDSLVAAVRAGGAIVADRLDPRPALEAHDQCALVDGEGRLLAVARTIVNRGEMKVPFGETRRGDRLLKPIRVFHNE